MGRIAHVESEFCDRLHGVPTAKKERCFSAVREAVPGPQPPHRRATGVAAFRGISAALPERWRDRGSPESACGVRREKSALSSGCKSHPANAPAGSNRGSYGGNEVAEAFGWRVTIYGDSASVQAVTRVNAEQASKRTMHGPT